MAELNSMATSNIAASTRKDAGSMGIIAFLGMIFLPLAAVSAFFSMAFFPTLPMKLIWLYPLCSIIFTVFLISLYGWWDKRRRYKNDIEWQAEWQTMKVRHGSCSAPAPPPKVAVEEEDSSPATSMQSSFFGKKPVTFASRVPVPVSASSRASSTLDPLDAVNPKRASARVWRTLRSHAHLPNVSGAVV